jgi:hypothetical protein
VVSRALAYIVAGIPAAIGVAFVARYAFVTSDTPADGIATAFLLGVIATGAFVGPAIAVAVGGNGRPGAAVVLWVLTCFAIVANWSHTLGAIAHRTAGTEAETAKASAAIADARADLARIAAERKALPAFTPATAETVAAARRAADTATKNREAECDKRGPNCRQRELDEQTAADKLATATTAKAITDQAAKLDSDAAAIRAQLGKAPAVKDANPLGNALARLMPWLPAASAATIQQAVVSAIAELLIAAGLALPELLRREPRQSAVVASPAAVSSRRRAMAPEHAPARHDANSATLPGGNVVSIGRARPAGDPAEFAVHCLEPSPGTSVALDALHRPYVAWCRDGSRRALERDEFAAQFAKLLSFAGISTETRGGRVMVRNVRLVA